MEKYDFSGWATRNDLMCSDGRIIRKDAFRTNDGDTVPLVWNHAHNNPENVLGHALLQNRDEGVYAYCTFNDTPNGIHAKKSVEHGDVRSLSIFANQLKQSGPDVIHGNIREVSLVLAGANPGAFIDSVMMHGSDEEDGLILGYDENIVIHAENEEGGDDVEETIADVFNTLTEKQKTVVYAIIGQAIEDNEENVQHADSDDSDDETVEDVFNTLTEKQKTVVYALIGQAIEDQKNEDEDESEGGNNMKHNVFEKRGEDDKNVLSHSEMAEIIADGKRYGSLKESVLQHGIEDVEYLFPDDRNITDTPVWISRDTGWVSDVMNSVHHTPFSRIKSLFADITEDEARAKGYIKGKMKKEEFFSLIKRTTTPTTVYKKQKMDRDDVIDITDFNVISWLKTEMRMMLNEELARAYLISDGRPTSSDDKINEQNIRPIYNDEDLFTIKAQVNVSSSATSDDKAKEFIRTAIKARKDYMGSGSPTLYTTEDMLTDMLLLTDTTGRDLYTDEATLARKLRVSKIVTVPVMEGVTGAKGGALMGIIVNLADYNVGADRGGAISMFDDFDIDYNAQKYLIETRCSGALFKPYSAIALELNAT